MYVLEVLSSHGDTFGVYRPGARNESILEVNTAAISTVLLLKMAKRSWRLPSANTLALRWLTVSRNDDVCAPR